MAYKIYKNKDQWILRHENGQKEIGKYATKEEAIADSVRLAKKTRQVIRLYA